MKKMIAFALVVISMAAIEPELYAAILAAGLVTLIVTVVYHAFNVSARR